MRPATCPTATALMPLGVDGERFADGSPGGGVPDLHRPVLGAGDDDVAAVHLPDRHCLSPGRCAR